MLTQQPVLPLPLTLAATNTVSLSRRSMKISFFWCLMDSTDVAIGLFAAWLGRVLEAATREREDLAS